MLKTLLASWLLCVACAPASARPELEACFASAARQHGVAPALLRAIAQQESGMQPGAIRHNTNGTDDLGLMQINTRWLPELARYRVNREALMQPCVNIHVGAWVLASALRTHGDTWAALGRYHSATPALNQRYAWAVYRRLRAPQR